jgi:DNA-binding MarR family transcriptional regulator
MNVPIQDLHKAFDHRIRLGIMSALAVNDELDFTSLRELLDVTDGNLATHIKTLEKAGFIGVKKSFIDNKPNTRYYISAEGRTAFEQHLNALEAIINAQKQ